MKHHIDRDSSYDLPVLHALYNSEGFWRSKQGAGQYTRAGRVESRLNLDSDSTRYQACGRRLCKNNTLPEGSKHGTWDGSYLGSEERKKGTSAPELTATR